MKLIQNREQRSRPFLMLAGLVFLVLVGIVDYLTGFEIFFSVFYLLGIGFATWFVGRGFGFFLSALSVVTLDSRRSGSRSALFRAVYSDLERNDPAGLLLHRCLAPGQSAVASQRTGESGPTENTGADSGNGRARTAGKGILEVSDREQRRG